jgi:hypothetical protein
LEPLLVVLGALALWMVTGVGMANYDTLYALVWGQQLAGLHTPRYDIAIAPTPHPLVEALGFLLSPVGASGMEAVTVALGFLALAGCGWVVYRLGAIWFGRAAGALAAVLLLTRVPVLSYGVRAYVDLPYLLLVLSAVLVGMPRPKPSAHDLPASAGANPDRPTSDSPTSDWPTSDRPTPDPPACDLPSGGSPVLALALLALAGLLRPEAWMFSGLYWLYLALWHRSERRVLAWLALLVASAPVLWLLSDLLVTGELFWSLTNTRHTATELARETGIAKVPEYIPRRIGEILRPSVLVGAAFGGIVALLWLRKRALVGAVVGVVAVVVFAAFASIGLPINTRYAFLAAALLCVFCGAGVFGWTQLPATDRHRKWWMAGGALVAVALLASVPGQYRAANRELADLRRQQSIQNELLALVDNHTIALRCGPVGVPNHRPLPLLALHLDASPASVVSAQQQTIVRGVYVDPATMAVETDYVLDRKDPPVPRSSVPAGFTPAGGNAAWRIYRRCA